MPGKINAGVTLEQLCLYIKEFSLNGLLNELVVGSYGSYGLVAWASKLALRKK